MNALTLNVQELSTSVYSSFKKKAISYAVLILSIMFLPFAAISQNDSCSGADPFCSDSGTSFPANWDGTGSGNGPQASTVDPGNNYGCLGTTGNPAWFYLEIDDPGNINLTLSNSNNIDIDFALWGPFPNISTALGSCNSLSFPTDCSYAIDAVEYVSVPNSNTGDVYLLLITNYANTPTEIAAAQTGGNGSTNCGIVIPCATDVGTINISTTGTGTGTNNLVLCVGDDFTFDSQGDYTLPSEEVGEVAELMYAVFDCAPTLPVNLDTDPCFSGLYWTSEDLFAGDPGSTNTSGGIPTDLTNQGVTGSNNTVWYIPVTVDDGDNMGNPNGVINVDQNSDNCFDFGTPIEVIYLEEIEVVANPNCASLSGVGSMTFTVSGGSPANGIGDFTVVNNGPGTVSPASSIPDGGSTVVSGLNGGDIASLTFEDINGCTFSISTSYMVASSTIGVSTTGSTLLCNGDTNGTVSVVATGGETPYTYNWNNGAAPVQNPTGLGANIYRS